MLCSSNLFARDGHRRRSVARSSGGEGTLAETQHINN